MDENQEAQDAAVTRQQQAQQRDLDDYEAQPDDGQGSPQLNVGMDARKAIYARHRSERESDVAAQADDPELEAIQKRNTAPGSDQPDYSFEQRAAAEAAGLDVETYVSQEIDASSDEPDPEVAETEPEPVVQEEPAYVTVVVDGESMVVPRRDVEAAGGVERYQKERSADRRFRLAAEERRKAQELLEKVKAEREALKEAAIKASDLPPAEGDARKYVDTDAFVDGLFKADTAASKAQAKMFNEAFARLDARIEEVKGAVDQPAQRPAKRSKVDVRTVNDLLPEEVAEVDHLMNSQYSELVRAGSPEHARVSAIFRGLLADPINRNRRPVDVARDAAEHLRASLRQAGGRLSDPALEQRKETKRAMGQTRTRAVRSEVKPSSTPQNRKTRSDVVQELSRKRGQNMV